MHEIIGTLALHADLGRCHCYINEAVTTTAIRLQRVCDRATFVRFPFKARNSRGRVLLQLQPLHNRIIQLYNTPPSIPPGSVNEYQL